QARRQIAAFAFDDSSLTGDADRFGHLPGLKLDLRQSKFLIRAQDHFSLFVSLESLSLNFQNEAAGLQCGEGESTFTVGSPRSRLTGFFSSERNCCSGNHAAGTVSYSTRYRAGDC